MAYNTYMVKEVKTKSLKIRNRYIYGIFDEEAFETNGPHHLVAGRTGYLSENGKPVSHSQNCGYS